jgi:hypothetical protein
MHQNTFLKLSLILLSFALGAERAFACSYGASTVCEKYSRADLIVVGKLVSVKPSTYEQTVVVNIERTYKGRKLKQIVFIQPQSTCDPDFSDDVGQTMLLYLARHRKTKRYSALIPGINGRIERMSEDLYWLNNLPMSVKRTRLSGTIELYKDEPFEFIDAVAGIKVRVFTDKRTFDVVTDKNGVYQLWDIPLGKYQIHAVLPPDLIPDLEMEKGSIYDPRSNYDSFGIRKPDAKSDLIDIQLNSCGGIDFVVNQKFPKASPNSLMPSTPVF